MKPGPGLLLWLVPPLAGLAGYFLGPGAAAGNHAPENRQSAGRKETYTLTRLDALEEGIKEAKFRSDGPGHDSFPADATDDDLKAKLLLLKERMEAADDWETKSRLSHQIREIADHLGVKGATHLRWMQEHDPAGMPFFIAAWAAKDPAAALDHIATSSGPGICGPEVVLDALHRIGRENPQDFLARMEAIPWQNFVFSDDPFSTGSYVNSEDDALLWIQSGAAALMLEQGMEIHGVFSQWADRDADAAMNAWLENENPGSDASMAALREILQSRSRTPERSAALDEALARMDGASLARLETAWAAIVKKRPWAVDDLSKKIPILRIWSPSDTTPDPR